MSDSDERKHALKNLEKLEESRLIDRREFLSLSSLVATTAVFSNFLTMESAFAWVATRMRKSSSALIGYQISRSLRFRSNATAFLTRTPSIVGNRRTFTWSGWLKRGSVSSVCSLLSSYSGDHNNTTEFYFDSTGNFNFSNVISSTQGNGFWARSSATFNDPTAFYHVVFSVDTTQANALLALKLYVNGIAQNFSGSSYGGGVNHNTFISANIPHQVGKSPPPNANYFDGYLCDVNFIDGLVLDPSSFGQINTSTRVWVAKKYSGTYGANGFYLPFTDTSSTTNLVKDFSGNANHWTPNNISLTAGVNYDSMLDVPLGAGGNARGNYAVLNPITGGSSTTNSGNLAGVFAPTNGARVSTIAINSGKWYAEFVPTSIVGYFVVGIGPPDAKGWNTSQEPNPKAIVMISHLGTLTSVGGWTATSSTVNGTYSVNDVIGVALNLDANAIEFFKNGVSVGTATINVNGESVAFLIGNSDTGSNGSGYANFGQRPFSYSPPDGFNSLHTGNLSTPTIVKSNKYFGITTWSGNNNTSRTIIDSNNIQFTPEFVWIKQRNGTGSNILYNVVSNKNLISNSTSAEADASAITAGGVTGFVVDGFSLGLGASDINNVNGAGGNYVAWSWKKGVTPGFDIVSYTGNGGTGGSSQVISHSLGTTPAMIIIKARSAASTNWVVEHKALPTDGRVVLLNDTQGISGSFPNDFRFTQRTATTFQVGSTGGSSRTNANTESYIAYLFAEVSGFSKIGSYVGNGSSDGPFIYCGFRPKFVMVKCITATSDWVIIDSDRDKVNVSQNFLYPNLPNAEAVTGILDLLSTGFKIRGTHGAFNQSTASHIFIAFAEAPFKYANAR